MFRVCIVILLYVTVRTITLESLGQAVSIVSLGLSVPHNMFLREHSRHLDLLQSSSLLLQTKPSNYSQLLSYSTISFMPSFIPWDQPYFQEVGGLLSFVTILIGSLLLCFTIFKVQRLFRAQLSFMEVWLIYRALIDWAHLSLIQINLRFFVKLLVLGSSISAEVREFSTMCLVMVCYVTYQVLLVVLQSRLLVDPTPQQSKKHNRNTVAEAVMYIKNILMALLLALLQVLWYQPIIYIFFGIIVVESIMFFLFNSFANWIDKTAYIFGQVSKTACLLLVVLGQSQNAVIVPVLLGHFVELALSIYKAYLLMMKKNRNTKVFPEKQMQQQIIKPEKALQISSDALNPSENDKVETSIMPETMPRRKKVSSLRKRLQAILSDSY